MLNRRFYLVNDSSSTVYLNIFHLDCSGVPWLDGLPRCTTQIVPPGAIRYCEQNFCVADPDFAIGVFADIAAVAEDIAFAVSAGSTAIPAREELIAAMAEEFRDSVEEAIGEEVSGIISILTEASSKNFARLTEKFGVTPQRLGAIMNNIGIGGAAVGAGAIIDTLLSEWKFFLTNGTSRVWQPQAAMVDPHTGNIIYAVTDAALADTGATIFEHDGWIRRSTDDISVWWSGNGIESLPGFSPTSPEG